MTAVFSEDGFNCNFFHILPISKYIHLNQRRCCISSAYCYDKAKSCIIAQRQSDSPGPVQKLVEGCLHMPVHRINVIMHLSSLVKFAE